jgi:hypothetical protein
MNDYEYRVLVTGSRAWSDADMVREALKTTAAFTDPNKALTLIHGGAPGLDTMAAEIAAANFWYIESYPAHFQLYGRAAGPKRNQEMVASGADICLAFPLVLDSWSGTMHCMITADRAGIPVYVCRDTGVDRWKESDYKGEMPAYMRHPEEK